ncbi:hypothetical protein Ancab_014013 [Ancistrocladus abbreviatus]
METQDHKKTDPSAHGVHVCHKCGWPFPNPHPSAKHRRAHKRVCGSIEGYKITIDSEEKAHLDAASDDDHLSDEDHQNPIFEGSKVVERTISRKNSSEVGGRSSRSNRSEDDLFSDTVTDFADIPVTEEVADGVRGLENMAAKVSENETDPAQSTVENAVAGNLCSPNSSDDVTLLQTIQHWRTENDLVESSMMSQDYVFRSPVDQVAHSIQDFGREELVVGENMVQSSIASPVIEPHTEGTMGIVPTNNLAMVETSTHAEASEAGSVVEYVNRETLDSVPAKAIVDIAETQSDGLKPQNDSSAEVDCRKGINSSPDFNYLRDERNRLVGSSVDMDEDHSKNCKEDEAFYTLKVPEDLTFIENPERMLRGYKDHNVGKFGISAPLDSSLTVEHVGNSGDFVILESQCASHSTEHGGPKADLSKDFLLMEDKLKEGTVCDKPMGQEAPGKGPAQISEIKPSDVDNVASSGIEVHPKTNRGVGGQVLSSGNFSQIVLTKVATVESCGNQETHSTMGDVSAYNNRDIGLSDAVESKVAVDELPATSAIAADSVEQTNHLLQEGDLVDLKKVIIEDVDLSRLEVKGGEEEGIDVMDATRSSEHASFGPESHDGVQEMELETKHDHIHMDRTPESANVSSVTENYSILKDYQDSDEGVKEVQSDGDGMIREEILGGIGMGAISNDDIDVAAELGSSRGNDGHADLIEKKTRTPVMDVYQDAVDSIQIEDNCTKELGENASGVSVHDESLGVEEDSKLVKQHLSHSASDILADSSSQTDSMEANWGSVSAATDTEAVVLNDSQQLTDTGKDSLKPEAVAGGQQSDKSGVFKPPSFMTLMEPKVGAKDDGDASKVQTSENPEHENSTTLQAGWLPSVTHVTNAPGRKENEQIIDKVTNQTTDKQQHTPLKSLLCEAQENTTHVSQKGEIPMKNNGTQAEMEKVIIDDKDSIAEAVKGDAGKEWNSPARYPANIKREKGKLKNRSFWTPFMCCSSIQTS